MDAKLVLLRKGGSQRVFPLTGQVIVIGRRRECDLRVPIATVSRRHCQLSQNGQSLEIRDLGSKTGTFVNGQRIDKPANLKAGDALHIGPLTFICQIDGKPEKITPPKKTPQLAAKADKAAAKAPASEIEDSFADLDASDSFIQLDESDSELEDLKDL